MELDVPDARAGRIRKKVNWIVIENAAGAATVAELEADREDPPPDSCPAFVAAGPHPHSAWA